MVRGLTRCIVTRSTLSVSRRQPGGSRRNGACVAARLPPCQRRSPAPPAREHTISANRLPSQRRDCPEWALLSGEECPAHGPVPRTCRIPARCPAPNKSAIHRLASITCRHWSLLSRLLVCTSPQYPRPYGAPPRMKSMPLPWNHAGSPRRRTLHCQARLQSLAASNHLWGLSTRR